MHQILVQGPFQGKSLLVTEVSSAPGITNEAHPHWTDAELDRLMRVLEQVGILRAWDSSGRTT